MKILKWTGIIIILLLVAFFLGPKPKEVKLNSQLPHLATELDKLDLWLLEKEKNQPKLKAGNEARIVWDDSVSKKKTPYSIVYLHGFSASHEEGAPINKEFAKRYGCNLYLSRLSQHGLQEKEPLLQLTPESLVESAKEAIAIGKLIGEKVILMSTSTGGTLSLYLASGNPDIYGLILYSPNIDLYDSRSFVLTQPWGLKITEIINGGKYYRFEGPTGVDNYWNTTYRIEALVSLKSLLNQTMKAETFSKVNQPVMVGYYSEDNLVSIPRIMEMYEQLGTPLHMKRIISFPKTGNHCIPSYIWSKDVEGVKLETFKFAEEVLHLQPLIR